jgi:hypothetical protein
MISRQALFTYVWMTWENYESLKERGRYGREMELKSNEVIADVMHVEAGNIYAGYTSTYVRAWVLLYRVDERCRYLDVGHPEQTSVPLRSRWAAEIYNILACSEVWEPSSRGSRFQPSKRYTQKFLPFHWTWARKYNWKCIHISDFDFKSFVFALSS